MVNILLYGEISFERQAAYFDPVQRSVRVDSFASAHTPIDSDRIARAVH